MSPNCSHTTKIDGTPIKFSKVEEKEATVTGLTLVTDAVTSDKWDDFPQEHYVWDFLKG